MVGAAYTGPGGQDPVKYVLTLARNMRATVGDVTMVAYRALAIMIERTMSGYDVDGRKFEPYSQDGPIYVYPNAAGRADVQHKTRRAASSRFARKIGYTGAMGRHRIGLKFESYAAYKASLGRGCVDLMGPHARMLQAVKAKVPGGGTIQQGRPPSAVSDRQASQFVIGLWDEALATIGSAHNSGAMTGRNHRVRLPRRHWFGLSPAELRDLSALLSALIQERMERVK